MEELQQDRTVAWGAFKWVYAPFVQVKLSQLCIASSDVDDVTQDVLMTVAKSVRAFDCMNVLARFEHGSKRPHEVERVITNGFASNGTLKEILMPSTNAQIHGEIQSARPMSNKNCLGFMLGPRLNRQTTFLRSDSVDIFLLWQRALRPLQ